MEIKTDNPEVAKLAIALHMAERATPSAGVPDREFIQVLRRFEHAYEVLDTLMKGQWSTDGMREMISRIEQDLKTESGE